LLPAYLWSGVSPPVIVVFESVGEESAVAGKSFPFSALVGN